ncbi:MAG: LLM class flavin-dependent oxidoreductase [Pseudomonadales bacterium]|nr:LLM class flavin-dependent oxidoreductase [Pseudomonadales bacterium]
MQETLNCGFSKSGRSRDGFEISCQVIVASGLNASEIEIAKNFVRQQIAFYASTPTYKPVLESIDRLDVHESLLDLSRSNKWNDMGKLIDDDILCKIAVVGTPSQVAEQIYESRGGLVDRISPNIYTDNLQLALSINKELKLCFDD